MIESLIVRIGSGLALVTGMLSAVALILRHENAVEDQISRTLFS